MNSREIELVLQARLESSDAAADASAIGAQMVQALEQSFIGLGERVGNRMVGELQQVLRGVDFLGLSGGGSSGSPDGLLGSSPVARTKTDTLTSHTNEAAIKSRGRGAGADPFGVYESGHGAPAPYFGDQNPGPYRAPTYGRSNSHLGMASLMTSSLEGIPGLDLNKYGMIAGDEARKLDQKVNAYQRFKEVKQRNPNASMSDYGLSESDIPQMRDQAMSAMTAGSVTITQLEKTLNELITSLTENSKALEEAKNTQKELRTDAQKALIDQEAMRSGIEGALPNLRGVTASMGKTIDDLPMGAGPWWRNQSTMSMIGRGMGVASQGLNFASDYTLMQGRGAAGTAQISNWDTRDVLAGDYQGLLTTQLGGGAEAMRSRASTGAALGVFGNIFGGAAAIAGTAGTPFSAPGAMVGAGMVMSGARDIMQFDSAVAGRMREDKALVGTQNSELIDIYGRARSNVMGAYQDAGGLGSSSYSDFLTGGGDGGVLDMSKRSGLTRSQIMSNQRAYVQNFGGAINGGNSLGLLSKEITDLNFAQADGFRSASSVSGAMYRGGQITGSISDDQGRAMTTSNEMYYGLRDKFQMEQGSANTLLENAGNRADQGMGRGTGAFASVGFAAKFASKKYGPEAGVLQRMYLGSIDASTSGSGPEGIAKFRAIQALEKRLGRQLTPSERYTMSGHEAGQDYMDKHFKKELDARGEDSKNSASIMNRDFRKELADVTTGSIAGGNRDLGTTIAVESILGPNATAEEIEIAKKNFEDLAPSIDDVRTKPPATRGSKEPGKDETVQEAVNEIQAVASGMRTLTSVLDLLEKSAEGAAVRLNKVADNAASGDFKGSGNTRTGTVGAGGRVVLPGNEEVKKGKPGAKAQAPRPGTVE